MFEPFSSGYYLGRLYVEPTDEDRAAIQRTQHERVNEQLYATGEGVERLDAPLVMKLDRTHLAVRGSEDVSEGTLAVPEETLESLDIENPPTLSEVLLAKADHARQLVSFGAV
ncbi:MAG: DUF5802 family protein [Halanaeroarchaeum sp.]